MNIFSLHPGRKNVKEQSEEHPIIHYESSDNTNEGGEFIDDAIRMHEQPLEHTEEEDNTIRFPENLSW